MDYQDIVKIERLVFEGHDPHVYMELYESAMDTFMVAVEKGRVVGYIVGYITELRKGRIFTLAVLEGYRKKGIGTALIESLTDIFKKKGVFEVSLEVRMHNVSAQHFYLKRGFYPVWVEKGYYSDGENAVVMKKRLGQ